MLSWMIFRNYLLSRRSGALVRIIAWHCIIGVGMGVAALLIVLSVMNGFNLSIRSRMLGVEPHVVVPGPATETQVRRALGADLESVARFETQDLILRSVDGTFGGAQARGYDRRGLDDLLMRVWRTTHKGEPPAGLTLPRLGPGDLAMGVDLARSLGLLEGDEVILVPPETLLLPAGEIPKFEKFRVKALVSTQMPEFDAKLLFYDLETFPRRVRSASREDGLEVRLKDAYRADAAKLRLGGAGLHAQTWGERDTSLFFALKMESSAMTLFLSLAVLITSFSIVIVMVLLMSQKKKDIGMLMALGLSFKRTRRVFVGVGLSMSFLGIAAGTVLGVTVCLILEAYPLELLPDIYTDSTLPAHLTLGTLLGVLVGCGAVAALGSWLPVRRTVERDPARSLKGTSFLS